MEAAIILLLHIGHAQDEVEVALTAIGIVFTLLGLGLAVMALWPKRAPSRSAHPRYAVRRRALREDETELLHEDVDRGAQLGALGEDFVDRVVLQLVDE